MHHITADDTLLSRLRNISEPVEIRDATGEPSGYCHPVRSAETEALYAKARSLFDFEKAKRVAREEQGGRPLAEILQRLQAGEEKP